MKKTCNNVTHLIYIIESMVFALVFMMPITSYFKHIKKHNVFKTILGVLSGQMLISKLMDYVNEAEAWDIKNHFNYEEEDEE